MKHAKQRALKQVTGGRIETIEGPTVTDMTINSADAEMMGCDAGQTAKTARGDNTPDGPITIIAGGHRRARPALH